MNIAVLILVITFIILLVLNVPVAFCMGIASMVAIFIMGDLPAFTAVAHKVATGIDSFSLLAIPFFILSGLLMGHGGIARRLIDFANVLVGGFRGGLAFVNILTCMFFGAISGSATAALSSVGGFMIPLMNKMGYERKYNTSITITAATTGLLIPPSNVMIVYSLATGGAVSIAAIFMAGVVPGILVGLSLMMVAGMIAAKRKYGSGELYEFNEIMLRVIGLILIVIVPVLILTMQKTAALPTEQLQKILIQQKTVSSLKILNIATIILIIIIMVVMVVIGISMSLSGKTKEQRTIITGLIGLLLMPAWFIRGFLYWRICGVTAHANWSLFLALYSLSTIAMIIIYGRKRSWKGFIGFVEAVPALLLIIIVLGGILKGVFTATEASSVAVLYSFLLAVLFYREVQLKDIPKILLQAGETTAVVFLLIGTSMAMSWVLAAERIPQDISSAMLSLTNNKIALLILINILLLIVGTFMDMTPAILIFTPIFLPIVENLGIKPLHFGIIMIMNLCIGLCTPPVGTCLFLGCGISKISVAQVIRHMLIFFAAMIAVLLLCTYIPWLSLWLPRQLGL